MKFGYVSLIGRPNAGKSTLLNRLVGTKLAIVSDKPQTTRHRILGVRNYPPYDTAGGRTGADGPEAQVVYVDTPGIHRPLHRMNVRMVDAAVDTIREVDLLALIVDVTEREGKGDRFVLDVVKNAARPLFLILNKIDAIRKSRLLPIIDAYARRADFAEIVPVSATTGDNVDRLERAIVNHVPEGDRRFPEDYLTDRPERFFAAEIVREQLLQLTRDEIPYSAAVLVDKFEEPDASIDRAAALLRLHCTIVVDRESQKAIVVGRGGDMIKRIGIAARTELERFFLTRVFLDLHVSVRNDWREDERVLGAMDLRDR